MPFVDPWDETTPSGAAPKSEGDDRIRELKRALTERLSTVFPNWPAGAPDDALIISSAALDVDFPENTVDISYGTTAQTPNPPTTYLYYDTDKDVLFVQNEVGDAYVTVLPDTFTMTQDLLANMPDPPTTPLFWATDTDDLYIREGAAYIPIAPNAGLGGVTQAVHTVNYVQRYMRYDTSESPIIYLTEYSPFTLPSQGGNYNLFMYAVIPTGSNMQIEGWVDRGDGVGWVSIGTSASVAGDGTTKLLETGNVAVAGVTEDARFGVSIVVGNAAWVDPPRANLRYDSQIQVMQSGVIQNMCVMQVDISHHGGGSSNIERLLPESVIPADFRFSGSSGKNFLFTTARPLVIVGGVVLSANRNDVDPMYDQGLSVHLWFPRLVDNSGWTGEIGIRLQTADNTEQMPANISYRVTLFLVKHDMPETAGHGKGVTV